MEKRLRNVLGLDCGTSSIGWAVTRQTEEYDEDSKSWILTEVEIRDGGVRLFDEMVDPKSRETLNAKRREKRGARKTIARRKKRMLRLLALMKKFGLIEKSMSAEEIRKAFVEIEQQNSIYQLRHKALDKKLSEMELVKVLYHLGKRRGFRSNRKEKKSPKELENIREGIQAKVNISDTGMLEDLMHNDGAAEVKTDKVYTAIEALKIAINQASARTLGEYFALKEKSYDEQGIKNRLRGIYLDRAMIEDELRQILARQAQYYPVLTENSHVTKYRSFWQDLRQIHNHTDMILDTILEPRPLKDQKHLIGECPYFAPEKRIAISSLLFQEFDIRSKINNMKYLCEGEKDWRELTAQQKEQVFELAWKKEKIAWKAIKKELGLKEETTRFNFEVTGRKAESSQSKEFRGGRTNAAFLKILGADLWNSFDFDVKEKLVALYSLGEVAFNREFEEWMNKYGQNIPEELRPNLKDLDLANSHDYASYSRTMLALILPLVKEGLREQTQHRGQTHEKIGYIDRLIAEGKIKKPDKMAQLMTPDEIEEITNPRIKKMLFEMRKLLTALERKYGDEIRAEWDFVVEMAREMRKDEDKKKKFGKEQVEHQEKRAEARQLGAKNNTDEVKYMLWLETSGCCAYCGKSIGTQELFSQATEIEHIVPLSRLADDSQANKTISCAECNRKKSGRLPWETWSYDARYWETMQSRWEKWAKENKTLHWGKMFRLAWDNETVQKKMEGFGTRQLSETQYGSKEIRNMLERWIGEKSVHLKRTEGEPYTRKRVATTKGGFTARVRQALGLNVSSPYKEDGSVKDNYLLARIEDKDNNPFNQDKDKKERLDHRHHFIDAVAMSLIGPAFEQRMSYMARAEERIKEYFDRKKVLTEEFNELLSKGMTFEGLVAYIEKNVSDTQKKEEILKNLNDHRSVLGKTIEVYENKVYRAEKRGLNAFIDTEFHKGFLMELNEKLGRMIVSQAITHKITGALHEETCYGVLRAVPIAYLDAGRIKKLDEGKYLSEEVQKALAEYVEEHKFIDNDPEAIRRTEADDKYLWAFRRGKQNPNAPLLPPALDMQEFWDETTHGPFKKDYVPLLRPLYTKSTKTPGKSAGNIADIRLRNTVVPAMQKAINLKAQYENLRALPEFKNKKKDWSLENLNQTHTQDLHQAVINYQKKYPSMPIDHILKIVTDENQIRLDSGQILKSVLLLDFATNKFIPQSPQDKHKAFDTGNNHHITVFKCEKESESPLSMGVLVTTVEVAERGKKKEPVIRRHLTREDLNNWGVGNAKKTDPSEWKFFCSLMKNDYVELDDGNIYRVVKFSSNKNLVVVPHFFAGDYSKHNAYDLKYNKWQQNNPIPAAKQLAFSGLISVKRKVYVDPLGNLMTAHD